MPCHPYQGEERDCTRCFDCDESRRHRQSNWRGGTWLCVARPLPLPPCVDSAVAMFLRDVVMCAHALYSAESCRRSMTLRMLKLVWQTTNPRKGSTAMRDPPPTALRSPFIPSPCQPLNSARCVALHCCRAGRVRETVQLSSCACLCTIQRMVALLLEPCRF